MARNEGVNESDRVKDRTLEKPDKCGLVYIFFYRPKNGVLRKVLILAESVFAFFFYVCVHSNLRTA